MVPTRLANGIKCSSVSSSPVICSTACVDRRGCKGFLVRAITLEMVEGKPLREKERIKSVKDANFFYVLCMRTHRQGSIDCY